MTTRDFHISSKKAVILGPSWNALFTQAAREGLIKTSSSNCDYAKIETDQNISTVLSTLVLYEEIIVPHMEEQNSPSIPFLEKESFYKPVQDTLEFIPDLTASWSLMRDHEKLIAAFSKIMSVKQYIVQELMRSNDLYGQIRIPEKLGAKLFFGAVIDFFHYFLLGDEASIRSSALNLCYSEEFIELLKLSLLKPDRSLEKMSEIDLIIFAAISAMDNLELALKLSSKFQAVSTIPTALALENRDRNIPSDKANTFQIIKLAISELYDYFPEATTIAQAVKLRKDPHIKSFRKQLEIYQSALYSGHILDIETIQKDVIRAHNILKQNHTCSKALKTVGYISLPIGTAESLMHLPPAVSVSLGVISWLGQMSTDIYNSQNKWVLLGRQPY